MHRRQFDESRVLAALRNPRVEFRATQVSRIVRLRQLSIALQGGIKTVDSFFALILSVVVVFYYVYSSLLTTQPLPAVSQSLEAALRAVGIGYLAAWLTARALNWTRLKALEEKAFDLARRFSMGMRVRVEPGDRYDSIIRIDRIPARLQQQALNSAAAIAFNRWTSHASVEVRSRFFSALAQSYPDGFWLAVRYDASKEELLVLGYSAIVPLSIESYQAHLFGHVSLFHQPADFILNRATVEKRLHAYAQPEVDLEKDGLAFYLLGMNVVFAEENGLIAMHLFRRLCRCAVEVTSRAATTKPYLYCATSIPRIAKYISENSFAYKGRRDINGVQLYESTLDPKTPGSVEELLRPKPQRRSRRFAEAHSK